MKYSTKQDVIEAAQALGSAAKTFGRASSYILAHTTSHRCSAGKNWEWGRVYAAGKTRPAWYAIKHNRRLCGRYVGMTRLPRYLSFDDRVTITQHPARQEMAHLLAIPVYARAYYIHHTRGIRRFSPIIRQADQEKGVLTPFSPIAFDAHRRYPWGRLQVHQTGECVRPQNVGVRTVGSNRDWNRRSTLQRFADYSFIAPARHGQFYSGFYVDSSRGEHIVRVSPHHYRIDREEIRTRKFTAQWTPPLPTHIQRRILAVHVPSMLTIRYDREAKKLMLIDRGGEQYHLGYIATANSARMQVAAAIIAFRKRRAEKITIEHPERVWVGVEDSYAAGNCRAMTDQFAADLRRRLGAEGDVCVRGDVILAARNDIYSRRAVSYAAARQI